MKITARYIDTCLSDYLQDGCNRPGQALCLAGLGGTLEETVDSLYDSISDFESIPESIDEEAIKTAFRDELFGGIDLRYIDEDGNRQDDPDDEERDGDEPYLYVVLEWDATVIKMRLTVDVEYQANGTDPMDLKRNLEWMVRNAMGEGVFTCDTDAEVNTWGATADEVNDDPPVDHRVGA